MSPRRRPRREPEVSLIQPHEAESEPQFEPNEIDFDDELEDDQLPLDVVEAAQAGVLLDDPERLEP